MGLSGVGEQQVSNASRVAQWGPRCKAEVEISPRDWKVWNDYRSARIVFFSIGG
jgi:hypothetical protein